MGLKLTQTGTGASWESDDRSNLKLTQTGTGTSWTSAGKSSPQPKTSAATKQKATRTTASTAAKKQAASSPEPVPAPAKAKKTTASAAAKKKTSSTPVFIRSSIAAPAVDPSAYGYDPMVTQSIQNQTAQGKPGTATAAGARRGGQSVYKVTDNPSLGTRLADLGSGAAKTYGGAMTGLGGFVLEAAKKLDESASTSYQRALNDEKRAQEARQRLVSDSIQRRHGVGSPMSPEERKKLQEQADRDAARARIAREYQDKAHAPLTSASDTLYRTGAKLEQAGQKDIERAKTGLGPVGRFGVDVGVAGLQMAADYAPAVLTGGGSALLPMFLRSAGGAAITGKESGADFSDRAVYALGSGALSVATEQISNVAGPFRKMFGAGVADRIASRLVSRFGEKQAVQIMSRAAQTAAGRAALSAFGEGFEEVAEAFLQAPLQRATINKDAKFDPVQAGYDFLVGAALGGLGGGQAAVQDHINARTQAQVQKALDLMQETRDRSINGLQSDAGPDAVKQGQGLPTESAEDLGPVRRENSADDSRILPHPGTGPEFAPAPQTSRRNAPIVDEIIRRAGDGTSGQVNRNAIGKRLARVSENLFGPDGKLSRPSDTIVPGRSADMSFIGQESLDRARGILDAAGPAPSTPMETKAYVNRVLGYIRRTAHTGRGIQIPNAEYTVDAGAAMLDMIARSPELSPELLALTENLPSVLQRNTWTDSKTVNGQRVDSYLAPAFIGDGLYDVTFDVLVSKDGTSGKVRNLRVAPTENPYIQSAPKPAPVRPTAPENVIKMIQDIQRERGARNGSILLNGEQLEQINQEIARQQESRLETVPEGQTDSTILEGPPLTPDSGDGTIQKTPEMEETAYARRGQEAYPESREDFIRRGFQPLEGIISGGETAFKFRKPKGPISSNAQISQEALTALGVPSIIVDGRVEINRDNTTIVRSYFEGGAMAKLLVAINNYTSVPPLETAAHEAVHFWEGTKARQAFQDVVDFELLINSDAFKKYQSTISKGYFGEEIDVSDMAALNKFMEEFYAHIAGHIHSGEYESMLRPMFRDYDAVKAAWNQLAEYGRTHPAGMPSSIRWGSDVNPESQAFVDPDAPADDGLGAANAGFSTQEFQGEERVSRMAREQPYTRQQGEATGLTREEYNRIFRYESQTEGRTTALAEELLYFMQDGHPAFIMDVDPVGYQELTASLRDAAAWNAEQMEAGRMILTELYGRSLNMEIEETEYTEWLDQVRQHETATGQGVQAISKWVRGDNNRGQRTLEDALRHIQENHDLPPDERTRRIRDIINFNNQINQLDETQILNLRDIILDIAERRGVLTGPTGILGQTNGSVRRGRALFGRAMEGIPFQQLRQFAFASVEAMGTDAQHMDPGDAAKTIQVLNMLSSLKTPGRNLTGNTGFYALDALAMDGAALLDTALAHATGTRSVSRGGTPVDRAMWNSALRSAKMSVLETALDVDMGRGQTMYGTGGRRTFRSGTNMTGAERGRLGFAGRFFSAMERNNSYLLTVPDEFFKGMVRSHQGRLQSLIDSGRIRTENANYAAEQAEQLARYRTFQDNSAAAVISTGIHDLLNLLPGFGDSGRRIGGLTVHSAGLGDIASPFARVAANLASRAVDYNPVTAARGALEIGHILYDAQHGQTIDPARQAGAVSRTARGLTGSALIGVFLMALSAGLVRRADDEGDDDVAQLNRSEGRSGQQWNISAFTRWINGGSTKWESGDKLLDISSLQPFNELLGVAEQIYKDENKTAGSLLKDDLLGMMYAAADIPMLETAGNLGKDLILYRKDPVDSVSQAAARTVISSLTPNLLNSVAQGLDDRPRYIDRENGLLKLMQDTVKSRIPVLRQSLPGSVDPVGQDKTYPGSKAGHFINSTLNPMGLNAYAQSEQSREWQRLREETGRTDFYPSASVKKTLEGTNDETGEKTSKALTYQERQELQRKRGFWLMPTVMEVMGNRNYQTYDVGRQADLMADVESFANSAAKAQTLGKDYVDKWISKTLEAQEKTGLPPGTVLIYRDLKNRGDGMKNEQLRKLIQADPSMSAAQKNALDDLLLTDVRVIYQDKDVDYSSDESFALSQMSDSAQQHWEYVRDKTGVSLQDYQTAWNICNRSEEGYHKEDRINDLMDQLGISRPEANRIWKAVKKDLDD